MGTCMPLSNPIFTCTCAACNRLVLAETGSDLLCSLINIFVKAEGKVIEDDTSL